MKHETVLEAKQVAPPQGPASCRYGGSRVLFRGPAREADGTHLAFVGGTETYGRFLPTPFPDLVEEKTGAPAINLGQVNGGIDVMLAEPAIVQIARDARLTIVEVTGALSLSNRFYSVHPRRNDRFVAASPSLRALYPEVDFAEVCFTRHLVSLLHAIGPERFPLVRAELQAAWSSRMHTFLSATGPRTVLLWLAAQPPSDTLPDDPLSREPPLVTRAMLERLRPLVQEVVTVVPSARAVAQGRGEMDHRPEGEAAASTLLGAAAHRKAAQALAEAVRARP